MLTLDQALEELAKLQASGKVTTKKLMELAAQVSLDTAPGFTQGLRGQVLHRAFRITISTDSACAFTRCKT